MEVCFPRRGEFTSPGITLQFPGGGKVSQPFPFGMPTYYPFEVTKFEAIYEAVLSKTFFFRPFSFPEPMRKTISPKSFEAFLHPQSSLPCARSFWASLCQRVVCFGYKNYWGLFWATTPCGFFSESEGWFSSAPLEPHGRTFFFFPPCTDLLRATHLFSLCRHGGVRAGFVPDRSPSGLFFFFPSFPFNWWIV